MKKVLFISIFLLFYAMFHLLSQTAKEEIKLNRKLSANIYLEYPVPKANYTAVPTGYKPFYISTYNRHGSRFLINPKSYSYPNNILSKADSLGMLTEKGKEVLSIVSDLFDMSQDRYGELTPKGFYQHQGIAERMFKNFPEIFRGKAKIDAKSTVVNRCIISMASECMTLSKLNSSLEVFCDASESYMNFLAPPDDEVLKLVKSNNIHKKIVKPEEEKVNTKRFMTFLFNNEEYVKNNIDSDLFMKTIFDLSSNLQSHQTEMDLYSLFNDEECYLLWKKDNYSWYVDRGASPATQGIMPYRVKNILSDILDKADKAIGDKKSAATLRFGHDVYLVPLAALLEINSLGNSYYDIKEIENNWRVYNISPMAGNIQIIFYKNATNDDILVKVMLNENEVKLPLKSDKAPYYSWKEFQKYYKSKIDSFNKKIDKQEKETPLPKAA